MASANTNQSTSSMPRLGPAWRSNSSTGGRGFQPPPAVPDASKHSNPNHSSPSFSSSRDRSGSHASGGSTGGEGGSGKNRNPFSLLDDEDDVTIPSSTGSGPRPGRATFSSPPSGDRFAGLRSGAGPSSSSGGPPSSYSRSASTGAGAGGNKPAGRSLADLAAGLSSGGDRGGGGGGGPMTGLPRSSSSGYRDGRGSTSLGGSGGDPFGGDGAAKVIRYTREKLLSLRPVPKESDGLPGGLRHLEGSVVVSKAPQDPVCWDTFDADEIWAQATRERRTSAPPKGGSRLRDLDATHPDDAHPSSSSASNAHTLHSHAPRRSFGERGSSSVGGRWARGVALPADDDRARGGRGGGGREMEAERPEDLWDDPGELPTEAAADFSQFGGSLEDDRPPLGRSGLGSGGTGLELADMSRAAEMFEEELHRTKKEPNGSGEGSGGEEGNVDNFTHAVDPNRPLASRGTTIQSGSGDHVNVFEDFGDPASEAGPANSGAGEEENKGEDVPIKSGTAEMSASSRLMKMIGVSGSGEASSSAEANAPEPAAVNKAEETQSQIQTHPQPQPQQQPQPEPKPQPQPPTERPDSFVIGGGIFGPKSSVPSNPWGEPIPSDNSRGINSTGLGLTLDSFAAREAEAAAQRQREAELRRRQQEEEEKKRWAEMQAKQQAEMDAQRRQQDQLRQQQQNQVELVLIERISIILEKSWGRSDLNSILSTLHAEDARVIAILSTTDALRALIARHPRRIALVSDPSFGAEMAALILTNAQWQAQQAQIQQAQAREQELQRRRLQEEHQRQQLAARQAALARAQAQEREAQEREREAQEKHKQQTALTITNAPWYYADPQGNIQGPFGGEEMRQWLEAGYFKGDLPISQNINGPFRTLSTFFPDPSVAFQPREDKAAAEARARAEAEARSRAQAQAEAQAAAKREQEARKLAEAARLAQEESQARLSKEAEEARRAKESQETRAAEEAAAAEADRLAKLSIENNAKGNSQTTANDRNEQSAQLKMMLGLGGAAETVIAGPPKPEPVQPEQPVKKQQQGQKNKSQKQQQQQRSAPVEDSPAPEPAPAPSAPPAPAWGGAAVKTEVKSKKSMSEIQQEEARAAAQRAKEVTHRNPGGGWANVAASGGSTAWGGAAVKTPPAGVVTPTPVIAGVASVQKVGAPGWNKQTAATGKKQTQQQRASSNQNNVDNFGANGRLTPTLENWCKDQMQKLNGSDDLTLVSFCMTLTDPIEIRQYLTAYLGSTPQVNNFATEFIKRKGGENGRHEEWESAGGSKKGRKKKGGK